MVHKPYGVFHLVNQVEFDLGVHHFYLNNYFEGFGVDQLRDDRADTYWQSDGQLPHLVNIQFQKKTTISDIYIYTDYKLDESYTPSRISIRVGTHFNDLQEIEVFMLTEPSGWLVYRLFHVSWL